MDLSSSDVTDIANPILRVLVPSSVIEFTALRLALVERDFAASLDEVIGLRDIMAAGFLLPSTALMSTNSVWSASALVLPDASVEVDGNPYTTPSAAAGAVKGGAANG